MGVGLQVGPVACSRRQADVTAVTARWQLTSEHASPCTGCLDLHVHPHLATLQHARVQVRPTVLRHSKTYTRLGQPSGKPKPHSSISALARRVPPASALHSVPTGSAIHWRRVHSLAPAPPSPAQTEDMSRPKSLARTQSPLTSRAFLKETCSQGQDETDSQAARRSRGTGAAAPHLGIRLVALPQQACAFARDGLQAWHVHDGRVGPHPGQRALVPVPAPPVWVRRPDGASGVPPKLAVSFHCPAPGIA